MDDGHTGDCSVAAAVVAAVVAAAAGTAAAAVVVVVGETAVGWGVREGE